MKKLLLIVFVIFISNATMLFGQTNTFPQSGNAGVGTTTPDANSLFHIKGSHVNTSTMLQLPNSEYPLGTGDVIFKTWVSEPNVSYAGTGIGVNINNYGLTRFNNGLGSSYIRFIPGVTNGAMLFSTISGNGTKNDDVMAIVNNMVGIGTTSPLNKLHIVGDTRFDGSLNIFNTTNKLVGFDDPVNYYIGHYPVTGSAGLDINWYGGIKLSDRTGNVMQITNGNIGIGTTAPLAKLDVFGGALNGTLGSKLEIARFVSTMGNASLLRVFNNRFIAGSDWYSSSTRIQQTIDATDMGYLEFNPKDSPLGLALGTYSGESMRLANGGNVGIGTVNPSEKLSVLHNGSNTPFGAMGIDVTSFSTAANAADSYYFRVRDIGAGNNIPFIIKGTGSVGIGTTSPISTLQTNGTITIGSGTNPSAVGVMQLKTEIVSPIANRLTYGTDGSGWKFAIGKNQGGTVTDQFVIQDNGNVSIGTTTAPAGYKLAIAGDMIAERVVVKLQSNWPDYVFKTGYSLRPLSEVENFVKVNNHLPDVPSESEVKAKGIDVEQINATLLKKVEELTLYMIELQKQNDVLKKRMDNLDKK